jgi:thiol-disulfide isomerase/thioredoxin
MGTGGYVLLAVLVLSAGFGIYRKLSDGKLRAQVVPPQQGLAEHLHLDHDHPPQVTFLKFSSEFCQPCRVTTRVLDEVTNSFPAICHIELDVVEHLDLVKTYGVTRTPTTLIIDKEGTVHFRAVGVPKQADLTNAVSALTEIP